jgi:hypothetical protein
MIVRTVEATSNDDFATAHKNGGNAIAKGGCSICKSGGLNSGIIVKSLYSHSIVFGW